VTQKSKVLAMSAMTVDDAKICESKLRTSAEDFGTKDHNACKDSMIAQLRPDF
jgi:hypothetical protein